MTLPQVIGIALCTYGVAQLVFARWFLERRWRRNEDRSLWLMDVRGLGIAHTRLFAVMSIVIGLLIMVAGQRLTS